METENRLCIPCLVTSALALSLLGWWAFYQGPNSAKNIRERTTALATAALSSGGHSFAAAAIDGAILRVTGTAPNDAARTAAFAAVEAAVKKARGVPGIFATLINAIEIRTTPKADDCQQRFNDVLQGKVIQFQTGRAVIESASYPLLDQLAATVKECAAYSVEVSGHTDPRGAIAYNKRLSQSRAAAVVAYLTSHGADGRQLSAVGYGSDRLLDNANSPEGLARNRRIEFTVKNPQ